jgi:hypothetical protein
MPAETVSAASEYKSSLTGLTALEDFNALSRREKFGS